MGNRRAIMDRIRNGTLGITGVPAVGIMQGRLLPMRENKYQGFPGENWATEFALANEHD